MRGILLVAGLFVIATFAVTEANASAPLYASCTATPTSAGVYGSCQVGNERPVPIQAGCDTCMPLWVGPTCTVNIDWTYSGATCN